MITSASTSIKKPEQLRGAIAHAPGKLILSGEHSVLYGAPALAMAVSQFTEVSFTPLSPSEGIRTAFDKLSSGALYPHKFLSKFKNSLDARFDQFKRGELAVHKILTRPDDLAVYTLASLLQDRQSSSNGTMAGLGAVDSLPHPGQLASKSDLPIGAGLGSSAAVVAATTVLFETLLDRSKTFDERYERVRFCERLKHGKAGPIDAAAVVYGGLVQFDGNGINVPEIASHHDLLKGEGWYWVLHGKPESSTGECVSHVREHYGQDIALWDAFSACTKALSNTLSEGKETTDIIIENQRLLERLGVVPEAAKSFVAEIQSLGGAAKICGAGSVKGSRGGAILVRLKDNEAMESLMQKHNGKIWSKLTLAPKGAAVGPAPRADIVP